MVADRDGIVGAMASAAGFLAVFAAVGVGLVALTEEMTRDQIDANERAFLLRTLNDVVPADGYDNDLFNDTIKVTNPDLLGTGERVTVYRAFREGKPVAAILTPVAPDGYSGPIRLIVGIDADGSVTGVRVTSHRETPGLGDAIEAERSDWILGFEGRSLGDPPLADWAVKRDGGDFDQFTGATVTPRAVVKAVRNTLLYFDAHRTQLFARAPEGDDSSP
jgi:electron transport complex protein RnfG